MIANHNPCQGHGLTKGNIGRTVIGSGSEGILPVKRTEGTVFGGFLPLGLEGHESHVAVYLAVGGHRQEEPG